jgi:hypothetical protein
MGGAGRSRPPTKGQARGKLPVGKSRSGLNPSAAEQAGRLHHKRPSRSPLVEIAADRGVGGALGEGESQTWRRPGRPWPLPVRIGRRHHSPSPSPVLFPAVIHETEASVRDLSSTIPEKERPGRDLSSTNRETVTTKDDLLSTNRLRDAPLCDFRGRIAQGSLPDAICRRQIAPRSDLGLIIVRQSSRGATRARWASEDSVRVARGRRDRGKTPSPPPPCPTSGPLVERIGVRLVATLETA